MPSATNGANSARNFPNDQTPAFPAALAERQRARGAVREMVLALRQIAMAAAEDDFDGAAQAYADYRSQLAAAGANLKVGRGLVAVQSAGAAGAFCGARAGWRSWPNKRFTRIVGCYNVTYRGATMRGGAWCGRLGWRLAVLPLAAALGAGEVQAKDAAKDTPKPPSIWEQDTLTGDWGGARTALKNKGIDIHAQLHQ